MNISNIEIAVTIVAIAVSICWYRLRNKWPKNFPPGPKGLPIIGNLIVVQRDYKKLFEYGQVFGGLFSLHLFGKRFIVLNDWKTMREALIGQSEIFSGRINMHAMKQINQFNDISTSDGPPSKDRKSTTTQLLRKSGFMNPYMENAILNEITKVFEAFDKHGNKPVEINECFFVPILNVIWNIVTGSSFQYDDQEIKKMKQRIQLHLKWLTTTMPVNIVPWLRFLPFDPFGYYKFIRNIRQMQNYLENIIENHKRTLIKESEPRDFIDRFFALVSNDEKVYKQQLKSLAGITFDILIAGTEATKNTMEYGFMCMAHWPEVQKKVQHELDTLLGKDRLPTYSEVAKMPYTEATVMEIHRFSSIVPLAIPHRTLEKTNLGGFAIPKDTLVIPNIYAIHHDKEIWGDPEVFRPERFIDADGKAQKPEYLIHFGLGPRSCVGAPLTRVQLFLYFAALLQRYSFEYVPDQPIPSFEPVSIVPNTIVAKPFHLMVKRR